MHAQLHFICVISTARKSQSLAMSCEEQPHGLAWLAADGAVCACLCALVACAHMPAWKRCIPPALHAHRAFLRLARISADRCSLRSVLGRLVAVEGQGRRRLRRQRRRRCCRVRCRSGMLRALARPALPICGGVAWRAERGVCLRESAALLPRDNGGPSASALPCTNTTTGAGRLRPGYAGVLDGARALQRVHMLLLVAVRAVACGRRRRRRRRCFRATCLRARCRRPCLQGHICRHATAHMRCRQAHGGGCEAGQAFWRRLRFTATAVLMRCGAAGRLCVLVRALPVPAASSAMLFCRPRHCGWQWHWLRCHGFAADSGFDLHSITVRVSASSLRTSQFAFVPCLQLSASNGFFAHQSRQPKPTKCGWQQAACCTQPTER